MNETSVSLKEIKVLNSSGRFHLYFVFEYSYLLSRESLVISFIQMFSFDSLALRKNIEVHVQIIKLCFSCLNKREIL